LFPDIFNDIHPHTKQTKRKRRTKTRKKEGLKETVDEEGTGNKVKGNIVPLLFKLYQ
jgi:hypothetical protein